MNRDQKAVAIEEIAGKIDESDAIFAVDFRGITVEQVAELRTKLRPADATFKVVKNSLTERAADQAGAASLKDFLAGPTALTFVRGDVATAAKVVADYGKATQLLPFKGGLMEGSQLDVAQIRSLSRLPSREVLYGQLVGVVASPIGGLVRSLGGLLGGLAVALGQVREKKESGEVPAGAPVVAEAPAAAEPAAEAAVEPDAEDATEAAASPEPEPDAKAEDATEAAASPEAEPDAKAEDATEAAASPEAEPDAKAEDATEAAASPEAEPDAKAEDATEAAASPEAEPDAKAEDATEAAASPEAEPDAKAEEQAAEAEAAPQDQAEPAAQDEPAQEDDNEADVSADRSEIDQQPNDAETNPTKED